MMRLTSLAAFSVTVIGMIGPFCKKERQSLVFVIKRFYFVHSILWRGGVRCRLPSLVLCHFVQRIDRPQAAHHGDDLGDRVVYFIVGSKATEAKPDAGVGESVAAANGFEDVARLRLGRRTRGTAGNRDIPQAH